MEIPLVTHKKTNTRCCANMHSFLLGLLLSLAAGCVSAQERPLRMGISNPSLPLLSR